MIPLRAALGLTRTVHTEDNRDGMQATIAEERALDAGLVFVNLVDFDMLFGHRRDATDHAHTREYVPILAFSQSSVLEGVPNPLTSRDLCGELHS